MTATGHGWLLHAWERGSTASPAERGAVLCDAAGMTPSFDAALDLSLDKLAAALARVYQEEFGPTAPGVFTCQQCAQVLDVEVPLGRLAEADSAGSETVLTTPSGRVVRLRLPTTRDMLHARDSDDVLAALVDRCTSADDDSPSPSGSAWPLERDDVAAVDARLEALAGAAAVTVSARCPACGARLSAPVDVADFVWERVQEQAPVLLSEVAALARAFGWSEQSILDLSAPRRRRYLAIVREAAR